MLRARDSVPHFEVMSIEGTSVRYSTLWQRNNLVLVTLPADDADRTGDYLSRLSSISPDLADLNTALVTTREVVQGVEPGVLVADRWGEICFASVASRVSELPDPDDLVDWARYLQYQCPECQGEAQ